MRNKLHLLEISASIKLALKQLNELGKDGVLFVVTEQNELIGSLTDGDIRRALLKGITIEENVGLAMNIDPKVLFEDQIDLVKLKEFRELNFTIVPILNKEKIIVNIINFRLKKSILPIDVVIMAGGKGERLKPLTEDIPKPLLPINQKPIIEYAINQFNYFGIEDIWITSNYLSNQLVKYVRKKKEQGFDRLRVIVETEFLGTMGAVSLISEFSQNYILVCNADLLTNIDLESFYLDFLETNADLSVLSIPYKIDVPYAVMDVNKGFITDLKEKPTFTYYSNGGVYLFKRDCLNFIPTNTEFMATDFIEKLIQENKKVRAYEHHGYWLDIGSHSDYQRAQEDSKNLKFEWI
jgi:dTDP-glucose pyrophosphorylase/CBS domain-containing protein